MSQSSAILDTLAAAELTDLRTLSDDTLRGLAWHAVAVGHEEAARKLTAARFAPLNDTDMPLESHLADYHTESPRLQ